MTNLQLNDQSTTLLEDDTLKAFSALCCEIECNKLVSTEDCQYWVFEQGCKAAIAQIQTLRN